MKYSDLTQAEQDRYRQLSNMQYLTNGVSFPQQILKIIKAERKKSC